jgi:hypothetical protein
MSPVALIAQVLERDLMVFSIGQRRGVYLKLAANAREVAAQCVAA